MNQIDEMQAIAATLPPGACFEQTPADGLQIRFYNPPSPVQGPLLDSDGNAVLDPEGNQVMVDLPWVPANLETFDSYKKRMKILEYAG